MDGLLECSIEEAVRMWLAEDLAQHEASGSVRKLEPRVLVKDGSSTVCRRPFKRRGHWSVRCAGTARLVRPRR